MTPNHAWVLVRASAKRWEGHVQAGLLSREIIGSGCRHGCSAWKATSLATLSRVVRGPRAVGEPGHVRNLHAREPGGPMSCPSGLITGRAAQGTLRRYA
jgi:hypothetical protein